MEIEVTRIYKTDIQYPPTLKKCKKSIYVEDICTIEESAYYDNMTEISLSNGEIIVIEEEYEKFKEIIKNVNYEKQLGIRN